MLREVDINDISDGKLYKSSDLVKVTCNDCSGCSECCRVVGDTILLDPLDIYNLSKTLKMTFAGMMEKVIELRIVDGCILPNMLMQEDTDACGMLDENGRCKIHTARPGFCRLFPLGRIYDDYGNFNYFIQVHECPYPEKGETTVSEWLGIKNLEKYEQYIRDWHELTKNVGEFATECQDEEAAKRANWMLIRLFYEKPYDYGRDFYEQFYERKALIQR